MHIRMIVYNKSSAEQAPATTFFQFLILGTVSMLLLKLSFHDLCVHLQQISIPSVNRDSMFKCILNHIQLLMSHALELLQYF